jgi:hypothetical protein
VPRPSYQTSLCPPPGMCLTTVGRTVFETDRLPRGWEARMNQMDEVRLRAHPRSVAADARRRSGRRPRSLRRRLWRAA